MCPSAEDPTSSKAEKVETFQRRLLKWFETTARDYPWRWTRDAYRILVAELMLQRTGASQVLPVYKTFLDKYPNLEAAVEGDDDTVASVLYPLGRTDRLEVFRRALQTIADEFNRKVPDNLEDLLSIPGVGMYTAKAVLCFAYMHDVAVLDNNVARILERVFGIRSNRPRAHTDPDLWNEADGLIPAGDGRRFNFAVLDLAALICRKRRPLCTECPVESICIFRSRAMEGDESRESS